MMILCASCVGNLGQTVVEESRVSSLGEVGDADTDGMVPFNPPPGHAEAENGGEH